MRPAIPLDTIPDRAWYAWHCLPRDREGRPPNRHSLEEAHGLPNGFLWKLFGGKRAGGRAETMPKLASALGCTLEWLLERGGEDPKLTGPIQPRTGALLPMGTAPSIAPPSLSDARELGSAWAAARGLSPTAIERVRKAPARAYTAEEWFCKIVVAAADERIDGK